MNAGQTATTGVFNDWGGRQKVESVYAELALPIRDNVDIQLAARYEDYENGYSEVTPKIAALWTPTDALTLRASWGQSFKGPSVVHLTADTIRQDNASQGVTVGADRYGPAGRSAISFLGAGAYETRHNTDLEGQTSDNYSLGFDLNVTNNISVGATYVIIEFANRISSPNLPTVIGSSRCFLDIDGIPAKPDGMGGLEELFVTLPTVPGRPPPPSDTLYYDVEGSSESGACVIPRNPDPAAIGYGTNTGVLAPVTIADVALAFGSPINGGFLNVGALDLRANMFWDTSIGMVSFSPNVSIVTEYEYDNPGVDNVQCPNGVCDGVGRTTARAATGFQSMPRWQGTFTTGLSRGDQNVRVTARYQDAVNPEFDDLSDIQKATFTHDEGVWTADISWFWQFNASSSLNTSIRNVASQDPPANSGVFFNRNRRTFSIQYTHSFAN